MRNLKSVLISSSMTFRSVLFEFHISLWGNRINYTGRCFCLGLVIVENSVPCSPNRRQQKNTVGNEVAVVDAKQLQLRSELMVLVPGLNTDQETRVELRTA